MALGIIIDSEKSLEEKITKAREDLKSLPDEQRPNSKELTMLEALEGKRSLGMFFKYGVNIQEAYLKIDSVVENATQLVAHGIIYYSEAARHDNKANPISSLTFNDIPKPLELKGQTSLFPYVYEYLKNHAWFEGAVDV